MPSSPSPSEPFLVGDFLVVPERNELRQLEEGTGLPNGEPLRLTSKQMDVLVALASKPGQPVSKNELFETVWPGVTVGEDNISSCIYELRKAFGSQTYIQTVRNRGYVLAPAVVRPLPARLLEALEPSRHESAEILLAGVEADGFRNVPTPPPEPPGRFERQLRRNLAIAFGALALLVILGLILVRLIGNFTVGVQGCENLTGEPDLDPLVDALAKRFFTDLDAPVGKTYYRVNEISFFASTLVSCTLSRDPDPASEDYVLTATISDRNGKQSNPIQMYTPREGIDRVGGLLIESVGRDLDSRVCRMLETEGTLLKAGHCLGAGKRLVKSRSIKDAEEVLLRAAEIYPSLLDGPDREAALVGLLETRDTLSNVYDIQGKLTEAEDQIEKALKLTQDPASGIDPTNRLLQKILLKIQRRSAQITGDVATEKSRLEELLDLDLRDADVRHSMGWFLLTHERACGDYTQTQFGEAIEEEKDPLVRATYYSYIGDVQLTCGQPEEAIRWYSKHIQALPEEADAYDARASAYIMIGSYKKARTDLTIARKLDHYLASALIKKGDLERDMGNFVEAKRQYQSALGEFSDWPNEIRDILVARGRLDLLQGNFEEAQIIARDAIVAKGGNQVQPFWLLGVASLAAGKTKDARSALTVLEKHFANTPSKYLREYLFHLRAQLLLEENRGGEALAELDAALDNNPNDRLFFLTAKAEALERIGRPEEALTAYRALLRINPEHRRSLCAAAAIAEKYKLPGAAAFYANARYILEDSSQDPVCQSCLERARAFEALEESPQ